MSYQSDINNQYYAISGEDVLAVLQALDSDAYAGTGTGKTTDATRIGGAIGSFDGNMKVYVNGEIYDLKNTHSNNSAQYVHSKTGYSNTFGKIYNSKYTFNVLDVIAIAKAAGYDNEAIKDALNKNYRADVPKDSKDTFKSQRDFRAQEWTAERVANLNSSTGPAYDSLKQWLDINYPGAIVETTLDPKGNKYHYRIKVGDQYIDIDDPTGKTYTNAELDKNVKQNGAVANVLQNQTAQNNLVTNAAAGRAAFEKLKTNLHNGATAETNFDLTPDEYKTLTVALPDFEKQVITNGVVNSAWLDQMGAALTQQTPNTFEGSTLDQAGDSKSYMAAARDSIAAGSELRKSEFDRTASIVQELKSSPELYRAVMDQVNADAHQNTITGQRASNLGKAVQSAAAEGLPSKAAEALEQLASAGSDSLAGQERTEGYNKLVEALTGYTNQQLSKMHTDQTIAADEVSKLGILVNNLLNGMDAEAAQATRDKQDEVTRVTNAGKVIAADKEAASAESIAKNNALTKSDADIADLIAKYAGDSSTNNTNVFGKIAGSSSADAMLDKLAGIPVDNGAIETDRFVDTPALRVNPELIDPNKHYIDESVYNKLINDPAYADILTKEAFDKYTKVQSADELASLYGLDYLKNIDTTTDMFTDYAEQANKASDRMLSQAQRAYLSALAAGDAQTIDALTKLTRIAGAPKQNLLNASALAQQFAQQQKDAAVGTKLATVAQQQRAANAKQIADAKLAGKNAWTSWLGSGNPSKDNGLYAAVTQGLTNTSGALGLYSDLQNKGMANQTINNNLISDAIKTTNDVRTDLATSITGLNSAGKVNNIGNSATANTTKLNIDTAQQQLDDFIKQNDPSKKYVNQTKPKN